MILKGAEKIVYDKMAELLRKEQPISMHGLAHLTGYSYRHVWRTLQNLRNYGLIDYHQEQRGKRATYTITGNPEDL
jgi:predicted transcriptional regulator